MSNYSCYSMVIKGDTGKIKRFIKEAKEETSLFCSNCGDITFRDNLVELWDEARWSVRCSTLIDKTNFYDDYDNNWLVKKSKDYGLSIRYREYEYSIGFIVDFEVMNGDVLLDDEYDTSYVYDMYDVNLNDDDDLLQREIDALDKWLSEICEELKFIPDLK